MTDALRGLDQDAFTFSDLAAVNKRAGANIRPGIQPLIVVKTICSIFHAASHEEMTTKHGADPDFHRSATVLAQAAEAILKELGAEDLEYSQFSRDDFPPRFRRRDLVDALEHISAQKRHADLAAHGYRPYGDLWTDGSVLRAIREPPLAQLPRLLTRLRDAAASVPAPNRRDPFRRREAGREYLLDFLDEVCCQAIVFSGHASFKRRARWIREILTAAQNRVGRGGHFKLLQSFLQSVNIPDGKLERLLSESAKRRPPRVLSDDRGVLLLLKTAQKAR